MNDAATRVVAIEARRSRFGYALFEGPRGLVDWSTNTVRSRFKGRSVLQIAENRLSEVLRRSRPALVVVCRPHRTNTGPSASIGPVFKAALREITRLGVPIHLVTRQHIWKTFGIRNRDDIAERIAAVFPELVARLPRRRKKWQPERRGMILFDAVAVGMTYWSSNGATYPPGK